MSARHNLTVTPLPNCYYDADYSGQSEYRRYIVERRNPPLQKPSLLKRIAIALLELL